MSESTSRRTSDQLFLPDFCHIRMVFAVVVVGELLAFVLALTPTGDSANWWRDLALTSMFIQWVGISSVGLLCVCRPWLRTLGDTAAALVSYGLVLVVTGVFSEAAYWLVARPVVNLDVAKATLVPQGGALLGSVPMSSSWHANFLLRNLGISAIISAVALRYFFVQHQWKGNLESEAKARIQALQSRIRPHFLFNSMNTIASLTRSSPELAEQVTEDLADLFRVSLGDAGIPSNLERELQICRQYLRIEEQRLGTRVDTQWNVDALPDDALLPGLSLQPLAENAVYHGIEPSPEGGVISIHGSRDGDLIVVRVANTISTNLSTVRRKGNQMAQDNVAQRLHAFFGAQAGLEVDIGENEYSVEIRFPYMTESA